MRKAIFDTMVATLPRWARDDVRQQHLEELDRYLDGEIYDHLGYMFYDEEVNGKYIKIKRRRPAVRFNIYAMLADHIARECFAGFNAPIIENQNEEVRKFLDAIKEETEILSHMIELTYWATTGSSVATFKVVPFDGNKAKAVMHTYRSKQCTPFFNELEELQKLRIHYPVSGAELLALDMPWTFDGKPVKPTYSYWFVRDFEVGKETTYYPIPEGKWRPIDIISPNLVPIETEAFQVKSGLNLVPAHWIKRRTGKHRSYDGRCVWEHAIPNVVEFDYSMSSTGAGCRYNAQPQVVIKGPILNADDDGRFIGGPSRYLHFPADRTDPDGAMSQSGSDAHLLEATGAGMKVALEHYCVMLMDLARVVICASRKDPQKITTAMSAKGMEVLDKEYYNLMQEFRTVCGENGYLKILKKIGAACIQAGHPLAKGITVEQLDGTALKWPPINPVGAQEFLFLCQGAALLLTAAQGTPATEDAPAQPGEVVMTGAELRSYLMGSIDTVIDSSNRDYLVQAAGKVADAGDPQPLTDETRKQNASGDLQNFANNAGKVITGDPIDTSLRVAGD